MIAQLPALAAVGNVWRRRPTHGTSVTSAVHWLPWQPMGFGIGFCATCKINRDLGGGSHGHVTRRVYCMRTARLTQNHFSLDLVRDKCSAELPQLQMANSLTDTKKAFALASRSKSPVLLYSVLSHKGRGNASLTKRTEKTMIMPARIRIRNHRGNESHPTTPRFGLEDTPISFLFTNLSPSTSYLALVDTQFPL